MYLRVLKVETFEEATLAELQTAVNAWLEARGDETLVHVEFRNDATTTFWCFIIYSEE